MGGYFLGRKHFTSKAKAGLLLWRVIPKSSLLSKPSFPQPVLLPLKLGPCPSQVRGQRGRESIKESAGGRTSPPKLASEYPVPYPTRGGQIGQLHKSDTPTCLYVVSKEMQRLVSAIGNPEQRTCALAMAMFAVSALCFSISFSHPLK